jgi:uncharacterized protein (DUF362 family)
MKLHPYLQDPLAVFVFKTAVPATPALDDYRMAAQRALTIMQLNLEGEKAVLKPNVTSGEHFHDPETGIQTHHGFVWGMAEYLRAHGVRRQGIYVLEDPRNTNDNAPRHWKDTGYDVLAQATGVKLRTPTIFSCVKKTVPRPLIHAARNVSRLAVDADTVLINVPKLKTHNLGITTLCMKNLMGADYVCDRHYCGQASQEFPAEFRNQQHPRQEWMDKALHEFWQAGLARRLIDLAQVVQPKLNVVEGVIGRDGTAFHHGNNYPTGLVVAGINMVAVDSAASYLMGFDPQKLIYLRMAAEHGLGCNDIARLHLYEAQGEEMVPCRDVSALRARPRFDVIRNIIAEDHEDYH